MKAHGWARRAVTGAQPEDVEARSSHLPAVLAGAQDCGAPMVAGEGGQRADDAAPHGGESRRK